VGDYMNFIKIFALMVVMFVSTNAFADDQQTFAKKTYLKAAISGVQTIKSSSITSQTGVVSEQLFNSNTTYALTLGAGRYFNNYLRGEVSARYINKYSPEGIGVYTSISWFKLLAQIKTRQSNACHMSQFFDGMFFQNLQA